MAGGVGGGSGGIGAAVEEAGRGRCGAAEGVVVRGSVVAVGGGAATEGRTSDGGTEQERQRSHRPSPAAADSSRRTHPVRRPASPLSAPDAAPGPVAEGRTHAVRTGGGKRGGKGDGKGAREGGGEGDEERRTDPAHGAARTRRPGDRRRRPRRPCHPGQRGDPGTEERSGGGQRSDGCADAGAAAAGVGGGRAADGDAESERGDERGSAGAQGRSGRGGRGRQVWSRRSWRRRRRRTTRTLSARAARTARSCRR